MPQRKITQLPPSILDQIVTERNVSLLFIGELSNDHYEALLLVEERGIGYY
jgi:hypothetical protein